MPKTSPLTSVSATRSVLEAHGLATKKSLGQHFLINDGVVERICRLAEISSNDLVIEVGPGIGTLTVPLLRSARAVVSVERDKDLIPVLQETCSEYRDRFCLIHKDALELGLEDIQEAFGALGACEGAGWESRTMKMAANLPYAVAATLVLSFFERFSFLESATVMVQKEVADRMAAKPGTKDYGAYTLKLSLFAEVRDRFTVGAGNFFPPPRVDSAVVRLDRATPSYEDGSLVGPDVIEATALMADAAFAHRRKTIANSCKTFFSAQGEAFGKAAGLLGQIFEDAGIDPGVRGESLSRAEFVALGGSYTNILSRA